MSEKMNKRIENVKDTTGRFKEKWKNGSYKKILKRGGIVLVILLIIGAGSAFALEKYEQGQESKVRQAETKMIQAQAKLNNITLISETDVKKKVSDQIGVDVSNITFDNIDLSYLEENEDNREHSFGNHEKDSRNHENDIDEQGKNGSRVDTKESNNTEDADVNTNAMTPVYKIECSSNSVEYEAIMDAVTGSFYSVDIED
ncbi:hypothetical protein [Lacrimispora defluvii]|jgi:hypothetical protein|uniref:Peptidase YpeB-like protein n=1 Tax=Lacrimispora defluvii TaxID=2719233 RepID=A0ABX1VXA6_9FIRM|nr:hypothetical protein [Lacrimispora defluvii]NNJ33042.1 hypothetical protein [Lacrimispora defluvii]